MSVLQKIEKWVEDRCVSVTYEKKRHVRTKDGISMLLPLQGA